MDDPTPDTEIPAQRCRSWLEPDYILQHQTVPEKRCYSTLKTEALLAFGKSSEKGLPRSLVSYAYR
jgi:hypothetical protein